VGPGTEKLEQPEAERRMRRAAGRKSFLPAAFKVRVKKGVIKRGFRPETMPKGRRTKGFETPRGSGK
jgi:hypothetical protein